MSDIPNPPGPCPHCTRSAGVTAHTLPPVRDAILYWSCDGCGRAWLRQGLDESARMWAEFFIFATNEAARVAMEHALGEAANLLDAIAAENREGDAFWDADVYEAAAREVREYATVLDVAMGRA